MSTKRTYQVHYWHRCVSSKYGPYVCDRNSVDAASPQEAIEMITTNRGQLPCFEVYYVLEIAEGWAVRQGKAVRK